MVEMHICGFRKPIALTMGGEHDAHNAAAPNNIALTPELSRDSVASKPVQPKGGALEWEEM